MQWYTWTVLALLAWSTVACINSIGKQREPMTASLATWVVITNALIVWASVATAQH